MKNSLDELWKVLRPPNLGVGSPAHTACHCFGLIVAVMILSSCDSIQPIKRPMQVVDCGPIAVTSLAQLAGSKVESAETLQQRLTSLFPSAAFNYTLNLGSDAQAMPGDSYITWSDDGIQVSMWVQEGIAKEIRVTVSGATQGLEAIDVVSCLGAPEAYLAWHGPALHFPGQDMDLYLLYPDKGIVVYATGGVNSNAQPFSGSIDPADYANLYVTSVAFYAPQTSRELLSAINGYTERGATLETIEANYGRILSWPGDWRDLELSTGSRP